MSREQVSNARIAVALAGSAGDFFPVLPIVVELERSGATVQLAAPPSALLTLKRLGFNASSGGRFIGRRALDAFRGGHRSSWVEYLDLALVDLGRDVRRMQELCDGCDVVVTHPFNLAAGIAAETLNIPVVVVNPFPSLVRTAHRRPPLDLASDDGVDEEWVTFDAELSVFDRPINAVRIDTGLRPTESAAAMLLFRTARLVLNLAEDWFYPPLPDWPATVLNIGYPYFCPPWSRADEDVQEFIRSGPPPVVVSLGTAMAVDPKNFWNVATDVLMSIGHRGVFVGRGARSTNDDLHAVSFVSLGPVLGASQALVHPGGLGMSYEAARAGIPSLVIPQAFDQFVNARRLCDLGCAIENRWDQLSVDSFEVGLKALFTSETRLRTAELAAECRARLVASSPAVRAVSEIARVRDAFGRSARSGGVRSE